jgi:septum formation protein
MPTMKGATPSIILASASPRRAEILAGLGLTFAVKPVTVDESVFDGEIPEDAAVRLAVEKVKLAMEQHPGALVLGADTIVVVDEKVLGKPDNEDHARQMLRMLSGRSHSVITAVAVGYDIVHSESCTTEVRFKPLNTKEIDWYIATGEPMDKAGAYGIQGYASLFIDGISGSYSNVVGLPVQLLPPLFKSAGFDFISMLK